MIRDIGQRGHEKRRKSAIVRGRGKAGGEGGGGKKKCDPLALPGLLRGLHIPLKPFKSIPTPPPSRSQSLRNEELFHWGSLPFS